MTPDQRRVIAGGCFAVAAILFVVFFARPFWSWISWNEAKNTIDLGIVKFSNRPRFPNDAKAVFLGLIGPVVLVTIGRVFSSQSSTGDRNPDAP